MDNNILKTFVYQPGLPVHTDPSRRGENKKDLSHDLERDFSKLFDEESSKTEKSSDKDSSRTSLVEEKTTTKEQEKKAQEKQETIKQEQLQKDIQQEVYKKLARMSNMINYLYNLMYKNPDALSMLEKKAAGLDLKDMEILQKHDTEYQEFKKMLSERGLKLSDLSFNQMAKLAQRTTKSQVAAYLDQIAKEFKEGKGEKVEKKTLVEKGKEKMAERMRAEAEMPRQTLDIADFKPAAAKSEESRAQEQADKAKQCQELMDQIIKQVDIRNLNERTELVMKLNPEYLGDLKMKINYEEGKMSARFETTSKEVRDMLNESADELVEMFDKKGLKLTGTQVALVDEVE